MKQYLNVHREQKYILYLLFICLKLQYKTNINMILILKYENFQIYVFRIYVIVEFFYFSSQKLEWKVLEKTME